VRACHQDADDLIARITSLRVNWSSGKPAPLPADHVVLGPRLGVSPGAEDGGVGETERSVRNSLNVTRGAGSGPRADYPVAALHHARLRELAGGAGPVPAAHGDAGLHHPVPWGTFARLVTLPDLFSITLGIEPLITGTAPAQTRLSLFTWANRPWLQRRDAVITTRCAIGLVLANDQPGKSGYTRAA
jgi:hypothetical protein